MSPLRAYTLLLRAAGGIPLPRPLRTPVFNWIAARVGMDLDEADRPASEFRCFREVFVRRLSAGARPIDAADDAIISPVDGVLSACGRVERGTLVQAKGIDYPLADLLGDAKLAQRLDGGDYFTLYLRPKDYHRIHAPAAGRVATSRRIGGALFPVQPTVVQHLPGLFTLNERLVLELETVALGAVAVVCVAAAGVGTVTSPFAGQNGAATRGLGTASTPSGVDRLGPPELAKGDELAAFNLGSTVILVFEAGRVDATAGDLGREVRMGQRIAQFRPRPAAGRA